MDHQGNPSTWLRYVRNGDAIERATTNNTVISLLASKNGTEVIHHQLAKDCAWGLTPQAGWDELESVVILSGKLKYRVGTEEGLLYPGDTISGEPVKEYVIFTALEDSSFLYITSNYVFHYYSDATRRFHELAVEIAQKDGYTAKHCERIRNLSVAIGEKMELTTTELFSLSYGAFFHDVGKLNIPSEILLKPGKLSQEEFDIIKQHTIFGKQILTSSDVPYLIDAGLIAEQHHERFDGSGYPYGLRGDEISLGAAIVAVVDSYDAMTSNRPYQSAKSREEAIAELLSLRGKLYHPAVIDAFLNVLDKLAD